MIRVPEVRLVDEKGNQVGVVPIEEARRLAEEAELDLVEVAPNAKPPVCKIIDHGKLLFDQRQRMKAQKKKQRNTMVKEIKMKLKIDKHDFETKLRRARKFLKEGDKVKFTLQFRGREVTHQEIGRELTNRILESLSDIAELEGIVSRIGRFHSFLVSRRKDYKPEQEAQAEQKADSKSDDRQKAEVPTKVEQSSDDEDVLAGGEETSILP